MKNFKDTYSNQNLKPTNISEGKEVREQEEKWKAEKWPVGGKSVRELSQVLTKWVGNRKK